MFAYAHLLLNLQLCSHIVSLSKLGLQLNLIRLFIRMFIVKYVNKTPALSCAHEMHAIT